MKSEKIEIKTSDGTCSATLIHPDSKGHSGVILYMDAFGPREALDGMGEKIAAMGHYVLVPDLFYREVPYGPFDPATAFQDEKTGLELRRIMGATDQAKTISDSAAFIDALTAAGATGPIGTVGYCMGGARALNAAAAYPDRINAAASFHGGNLAGDNEDSPHLMAPDIKAKVYVGSAGIDRSFPPEQSARLAQALREAEIDYVIENYTGMQHGWCVPDHGVYNQAGAQRHWKRLEVFFGEALIEG